MSESREQDKKTPSSKAAANTPSAGSAGTRAGSGGRKARAGSLRTWVRAKRPVLGFVVLFAVLMGGFYALTFIETINVKFFPAYMRFNARSSSAILNLFGEGSHVSNTMVSSPRFSVDIQHGCDAIEPSALFVAAVLAFPAPLRSKLPGVLIGTLALSLINFIRIVSLFYAGIYWPSAFQTIHVDVWQPVFILLSLTFWVMWAWWATRDRAKRPNVCAETN